MILTNEIIPKSETWHTCEYPLCPTPEFDLIKVWGVEEATEERHDFCCQKCHEQNKYV